ncbi:MAG: hypothetical protein R3E32_17805 [Chitinophagales bacterium]
MIITHIQTTCNDSDVGTKDIYIEISRIRDGSKIYNSRTGYLGHHQQQGAYSWTERLPKSVKNEDAYLLLCLNKQNLYRRSIKYTTFCPHDFEVEKPNRLNFEVDVYDILMEVSWE